MIADHDLKKAICPRCVNEVRVDVLHEESTHWAEDNVDGSDRYWILRCRGCDNVFFGHGSTFSEVTDHEYDYSTGEWHLVQPEEKTFYPRAIKRKKPDWYDWRFQSKFDGISSILTEVYTALDHGLLMLSAVGIRTVFDRISDALNIDPALPFNQKIEKLRSQQHITGRERDLLELLVDAGGAAIHAGWNPSMADLTTMMEIVEGTIHRSLILPKLADKIRATLPPKQITKPS